MRTLTIIISLAALFSSQARGTEIIGESADTFIFETMPDRDFSSMPFLGVSSIDGHGALAYLSFKIEPLEYGLLADKGGKIIDARLELTAYALPELSPALSDEEKAENTKIKMNVYAVIDEECFDPAEAKTPVSWDGEHKFPAPKHDCATLKMDASGIVFLGEIHVDLLDENFLESRKIIFAEDSLREFLNFACGVKEPDRKLSIVTGRESIKYAAIILKQISGAEGLLICSADYNANKEAEKLAAEKRVEKHNKSGAAKGAAEAASQGGAGAAATADGGHVPIPGGLAAANPAGKLPGESASALERAILREDKLASLIMEQDRAKHVGKTSEEGGENDSTNKDANEAQGGGTEDPSSTSTVPLPKIVFEFTGMGAENSQ